MHICVWVVHFLFFLMYSVIRMVLSTHYTVQLSMDTLNLPNTSSTNTSVMCTAKTRCINLSVVVHSVNRRCMCMCLCAAHVLYVNICCVEQNRHSPLVMCGKCVYRVCSLCDGMCVTDTCPLLLQYEWTLLHSAALGGSVGLIEWLMANHKFAVEAKTKVLLCHTCYTEVHGPYTL